MTPEGKVKAAVKKILDAADETYYHCPVQNGMGAPTLDFVGCSKGRYFAIETKAPGKKPTTRQEHTSEQMRAARGTVFIMDGSAYEVLSCWLKLG